MAIEVYKILHFMGIFMLFLSIGGLLTTAINMETAAHRWRKALAITHGVGLLLILLGGFGMLARLGILWPMPGWVLVKLIIWVMLGGLIALVLQSDLSKILWILVIVLGVIAAYLGTMKPF